MLSGHTGALLHVAAVQDHELLQLCMLHEAVLGETLFKDTFRRRMEPQLVLTDEKSSGVRGPRAAMYRRPS